MRKIMRNPNQRVWLLCHHCDFENEVTMEAKVHQCACCGAYLAPCSLCNLDTCDCANCELSKKAEVLNKKQETEMDKAIAYVASEINKDEVKFTYELMTMRRVPMFSVNPHLSDQIYDLMEEYGQDNDLPEDWWLYDYDEEDIFLKLVDKYNE